MSNWTEIKNGYAIIEQCNNCGTTRTFYADGSVAYHRDAPNGPCQGCSLHVWTPPRFEETDTNAEDVTF
jgi:hypothetical protein